MKPLTTRHITPLRAAALLLMLCFVAATAAADNTRTVSAEFTYYGDDNITMKEARAKAIEGARIKALAEAFGTIVTQSVISDQTHKGGEEDTYFASLSETQVKGEWISDVNEPEVKVNLNSDGTFSVWCRVKGLARALSNKTVDYDVMILRNGREKRHADTRFRNGDDLRLYFKAPVDGYLAVYLATEDRQVQTLLPYISCQDGYIKVRHDREYVFFDDKLADPAHGTVDEMCMETSEPIERDRFYILFSPNPFIKANDKYTDEGHPRSLSFNDFHRWLSKLRKNDPNLGYKEIDIVINNEEAR